MAERVTILEPTAVSFSEIISSELPFVEGKSYTVTLTPGSNAKREFEATGEPISYIAECKATSFEGMDILYVGNLGLWAGGIVGDNTGEVFLGATILGQGKSILCENLDSDAQITVAEAEVPSIWESIVANGGKDYAIGDSVMLDLGTIDGIECGSVRMCKVAEGEGGTSSTWLALDALAKAMGLNSTNTNKGGWEACERRAWLNGAFLNGLPEYLRNAIVPTTRYSDSYDTDGNWVNSHPTIDHIWIPSVKEISVGAGSGTETKGTYYKEWFANSNNNKLTLGYGGSSYRWWHRSVSSGGNGYFRGTSATGGTPPGTGSGASNLGGIVIGFSIKAVSDNGISTGKRFLLEKMFPHVIVKAILKE